ncbi:MAG: methionyl-tRNA formyltransferase [Elusimicrobia bacterium]|nr:methionyl-tRNA formyltransferase [Elusimicrobiota bacterium]
MKIVIATIKSWNIKEAKKFISKNKGLEITLITDEKKLTYRKIRKINPRYIFFPHWSWIIPEEIYKNYECVVFHMTDLPFGRGGSPLQNLIVRGIYKTKITAIKVVKGIDAGDIYLKRPLSLQGSASRIFKNGSRIVFRNMIPYIIKKEPVPIPQKGKAVSFTRRRPEQGNIVNLTTKKKVYDYIRMLDAEGYLSAFVETAGLKIEFSNARSGKNCILSDAKISIKRKRRIKI